VKVPVVRFVVVFLFLVASVFAQSPAQKYPAYSYVFSEFDIQSDYIYTPEFERFAAQNEKGLSRFYKRSIQRGEWLISLLRGELMEEGLSDLFLYLSIVESGLNIEAVSSKKAVGLWQFMPKTARMYRLKVCEGEDERCDPFSATRAAIKHLRYLHRKFGKWYLAILAYNCGEGCVDRAIKKAGTDTLEILIDPQARYLPKETREYLYKILLVSLIAESESVEIESVVLPREHTFVPVQYADMNDTHFVSHIVTLGETVDVIAAKYGTYSEEIKRINQMETDMLEVGRVLLIPVSAERFEKDFTQILFPNLDLEQIEK